MRFEVTVTIRPKAGLRDPEGSTIRDALHALGYGDVGAVHVGRQLRLEVESAGAATAEAEVEAMAQRILANPVIEDYSIAVAEVVA